MSQHDSRALSGEPGTPPVPSSDTDTGTGTATANGIGDSTQGDQQWQQLLSFSTFLTRLAAAQEGGTGGTGQLARDGSFPDLTTFGLDRLSSTHTTGDRESDDDSNQSWPGDTTDLTTGNDSMDTTEGGEGEDGPQTLHIDLDDLGPWVASNLPFLLIFATVFVYLHAYGIIAIIWLTTILAHMNFHMKALFPEAYPDKKLLLALFFLAGAHISLVYSVFYPEHLWTYLTIYFPRPDMLTFWDMMWIAGVNDFVVRYALVMIKTVLLLLLSSSLTKRRKGALLATADIVVLVYRTILPIPLWFHYLLYGLLEQEDKTKTGPTLNTSSTDIGPPHIALTAMYIIFKLVGLYNLLSGRVWASVTTWWRAPYGQYASRADLQAHASIARSSAEATDLENGRSMPRSAPVDGSAGIEAGVGSGVGVGSGSGGGGGGVEFEDCSICQDNFVRPVMLPCKHIFCEDCLHDWLQRENTCPLCRAVIAQAGFKTENDGTTSLMTIMF